MSKVLPNSAMSDTLWLCSHVICPYPVVLVALRCGFHLSEENLKIFEGININSERAMAKIQHLGVKIKLKTLTF